MMINNSPNNQQTGGPNPDPIYDPNKIVAYLRSKLDAVGKKYSVEGLYKIADSPSFKDNFAKWHVLNGFGKSLPTQEEQDSLFKSWIIDPVVEKKNQNAIVAQEFADNPNVATQSDSDSQSTFTNGLSSSDSNKPLSLEEEFGAGPSSSSIPEPEEQVDEYQQVTTQTPQETQGDGQPVIDVSAQNNITGNISQNTLNDYSSFSANPDISPIGSGLEIDQSKYITTVVDNIPSDVFKMSEDDAQISLLSRLGAYGYDVKQMSPGANVIEITRPDGESTTFRLLSDSYRERMIDSGQTPEDADRRINQNIQNIKKFLYGYGETGVMAAEVPLMNIMAESFANSQDLFQSIKNERQRYVTLPEKDLLALQAYNGGNNLPFIEQNGTVNLKDLKQFILNAKRSMAPQVEEERSVEEIGQARMVMRDGVMTIVHDRGYVPPTPGFLINQQSPRSLDDALAEQAAADERENTFLEADAYLTDLQRYIMRREETASKMMGSAMGLSGSYKNIDLENMRQVQALVDSGINIKDLPTDGILINGNPASVNSLLDVIGSPDKIQAVREGKIKLEVTDHPEAFGYMEPFLQTALGWIDSGNVKPSGMPGGPFNMLGVLKPKFDRAVDWFGDMVQRGSFGVMSILSNIGTTFSETLQVVGMPQWMADSYVFSEIGIPTMPGLPHPERVKDMKEAYLPYYNEGIFDANSFAEFMSYGTEGTADTMAHIGAFMVNPYFGLSMTGISGFGSRMEEYNDMRAAALENLKYGVELTQSQKDLLDMDRNLVRFIALEGAAMETGLTSLFTFQFFKNLAPAKNFKGAKTAENAKKISDAYTKSLHSSLFKKLGVIFGIDPAALAREVPEELLVETVDYGIKVMWGLEEYDGEVYADLLKNTGIMSLFTSAGMGKMAQIGKSKRAREAGDLLIMKHLKLDTEADALQNYFSLEREIAYNKEMGIEIDSDLQARMAEATQGILNVNEAKKELLSQIKPEDRAILLEEIVKMAEGEQKLKFYKRERGAERVPNSVRRAAKRKILASEKIMQGIFDKYTSEYSWLDLPAETKDRYYNDAVNKINEKYGIDNPAEHDYTDAQVDEVMSSARDQYLSDVDAGRAEKKSRLRPKQTYSWSSPSDFVPDVSQYRVNNFNLDRAIRDQKMTLSEKSKSKDTYHGTGKDFDSQFNVRQLGSSTKALSAREGFFFTQDIQVADSFAQFASRSNMFNQDELNDISALTRKKYNEGGLTESEQNRLSYYMDKSSMDASGAVKRIILDYKNPFVYDAKNKELTEIQKTQIIRKAKRDGYDAVEFKNLDDSPFEDQPSDVQVVWDESLIIDVSSMMDPANARSREDMILSNLYELNTDIDLMASLPTAQKKVIVKYFQDINDESRKSNPAYAQVEAIIKSAQIARDMAASASGKLDLFPTADVDPNDPATYLNGAYSRLNALALEYTLINPLGSKKGFMTADAFLNLAFRNPEVRKTFLSVWNPIVTKKAEVTKRVNETYDEESKAFAAAVTKYNQENGTNYDTNINGKTNSYEQYLLAMAYRKSGVIELGQDVEFSRAKLLIMQALDKRRKRYEDNPNDAEAKDQYEILKSTYDRLGFSSAMSYSDLTPTEFNDAFIKKLASMQNNEAALKRITDYGGDLRNEERGTDVPFVMGSYVPVPFVKNGMSLTQQQKTKDGDNQKADSNPDAASLNIISFPDRLSDDFDINPGMYADNAFSMMRGAEIDIATRDNMTSLMYLLDHPDFVNMWSDPKQYEIFKNFFVGKKDEYNNIVAGNSNAYVDVGATNGYKSTWKQVMGKAASAYYSTTAAIGLARPSQRLSQYQSAVSNIYSRLNSSAATAHLMGHNGKFFVGLSAATNGVTPKTMAGRFFQKSLLGSGDLSNIHAKSRTNLRNALKAEFQLGDKRAVPVSYYLDYMKMPYDDAVVAALKKYKLFEGLSEKDTANEIDPSNPDAPKFNPLMTVNQFLDFVSSGSELSLDLFLASADRSAATASFEALYIDHRVRQGEDLSGVSMKEWWAKENENPNMEAINYADGVIAETMRQTGSLSEAPIYLEGGGTRFALQSLMPFSRFSTNAKSMFAVNYAKTIDPNVPESEKQQARANMRGIGYEIMTFQAVKQLANIAMIKGFSAGILGFGLEEDDVQRFGGYSQVVGTTVPIEDRQGILESLLRNDEREQRYQDFLSGESMKNKVTKEGQALATAQQMEPNIDDAAYFMARWAMEYENKFKSGKQYPILMSSIQDFMSTSLPVNTPDFADDLVYMQLNKWLGSDVFNEFISGDLEESKTKGGFVNMIVDRLGVYGIGIEATNKWVQAYQLYEDNARYVYTGDYGFQKQYIGPGGPNEKRMEKLQGAINQLLIGRTMMLSPGIPKGELNKYLNYLQRAVENEFRSTYTTVDENGNTVPAPDPMMIKKDGTFNSPQEAIDDIENYRREYEQRTNINAPLPQN